jgi:hypothetical protein
MRERPALSTVDVDRDGRRITTGDERSLPP